MKKAKVYFLFILFLFVKMEAFAQNTSPIGTWEGFDDINREIYLEIGQQNWNMWVNGSFFGSGTYRIDDRFTYLILNSGREYGAFYVTIGDKLLVQRLESNKVFYLNRLSSVDPTGSSSSSQSSSYNPANSNYLLIGYNFAYDAPIGLTIADSMFFKKSLMYISANFGFSSDPDRFVIEWIYGIAISITDWLRIPIGIGGNHSYITYNEEIITGSWYDSSKTPPSGNYYGTKKVSEEVHSLVIEVGVQPVIKDRFYLSATYRLIGFSRSGFTIGAGIIF